MNSSLFTGLLFCLAGSPLHVTGQEHNQADKAASQDADKGKADSTNNPIEAKTDRFSNVTTVTLKPLAILDRPDHVITMEINTKLGEKKISDWEREMVNAYVTLESQTKAPVDFGDEEIHFIINGQPLKIGKADFKVDPYPSIGGKLKPGFKLRKFTVVILERQALEQFSKANRIEMRIGSIEPSLSNTLITTLREYATQTLAQHKIAKERKQ
ncbi:MAG TPA: hypothetical protein VG324_18810 [Blastocatellia bacterium]|nr:hypothetical protein [Blastocatellia bacterium]